MMKHTSKRNAGFTLIELVVAIAIATIVTAAATSVLLMGLRINHRTGDTASRQMTVSTLLNTVERIIAEGSISDIEMNTDHWRIKDKEEKVLLSYVFDEESLGTVYVGDYNSQNENAATPILSGLLSSYVEMYAGLFTIYVETEEGMFSSSVFCRSLATDVGEHGNLNPDKTTDSRLAFLDILKKEYGSRGEIKNGDGTYTYYSEWYIGGYEGNPGWNYKTPWCACYISWALSQTGVSENLPSPPKENWYANVDDFMEYFTPKNATETATDKWLPGGSKPTVGDLIFFDWNKGTNPQHVGVVLSVSEDGKYVYTIEGNSAGRVTVRSYLLNDPRIIGYGILPWTSESQSHPVESLCSTGCVHIGGFSAGLGRMSLDKRMGQNLL